MTSSHKTIVEALEDLGRDWADETAERDDHGDPFLDRTQWEAFWLVGGCAKDDVRQCLDALGSDMPLTEALDITLAAGWRALPAELKGRST